MAFGAQIFSLFIAGSTDVSDEQSIVRQTVDEWNRHHGSSRNAFITVTSWTTHSHPAAGAEPQAIINKQVLDSADIVVGLFWTRFGSPTSSAESGTVEEIERSITAKKRVMLYFSNRPLPPTSLDQVQYAKIVAFRERFRHQGLYGEYASLENFRDAFRTHLALVMNGLFDPGDSSQTSNSGEEAISIAFSPTYWVVVLGALNTQVQLSLRSGAALAARGVKPEEVSDADRTALAAPILIRAWVIDVLVKHGIMRPEAAEELGYEATLRAAGYPPE